MDKTNREEKNYRVLLTGIGDHTEERRDAFCRAISTRYTISFDYLKQVADRCPVVIKKDLSRKKAEAFARVLRSYGAAAIVEERSDSLPIVLEFQDTTSFQGALISAQLQRTPGGRWILIGRIENLSERDLVDIWVLVQAFDRGEELLTFEESPLPINPLPPGGFCPFKVILDGSLPIQNLSVVFKNSSGNPLPVIDRRKRREWTKIGAEGEEQARVLLPMISESSADPSPPGDQNEVLEEDDFRSLVEDPSAPVEGESGSLKVEEEQQVENGQGIETETSFPEIESDAADADAGDKMILGEENDNLPAPAGLPLSDGPLPPAEDGEESTEPETLHSDPIGPRQVMAEDTGAFSFPWMEDFRKSVEADRRKNRDDFSEWFERTRGENGFEDSFHSLSTILIHARFDPYTQTGKALANTRKVYRFVVQPALSCEAIPLMEGTDFFSGEQWRDLFCRAIPRIQEISRRITEEKRWDALELEKLVQIVPHMSDKNSRKAIRWIEDLIPGLIGINFSRLKVPVSESLYRVACRLGILDPYFDVYHGIDSIGELKIQSFSAAAFPADPTRVEPPMNRMGLKREEGGHCMPIRPQCEGCLFEAFCPRLHPLFDPAEKGMIGGSGSEGSPKE